jgi:hypothetical protein
MKNEGKIIELLTEMVDGQDRLVGQVSEMKDPIKQMNVEIMKQGLQTDENSRAILKLADEIRLVAQHEKRISKLEVTVFK